MNIEVFFISFFIVILFIILFKAPFDFSTYLSIDHRSGNIEERRFFFSIKGGFLSFFFKTFIPYIALSLVFSVVCNFLGHLDLRQLNAGSYEILYKQKIVSEKKEQINKEYKLILEIEEDLEERGRYISRQVLYKPLREQIETYNEMVRKLNVLMGPTRQLLAGTPYADEIYVKSLSLADYWSKNPDT